MKKTYRVSLSSLFLLLIFTAVAITAVFIVQGNGVRLRNRKLGHGFLSENAVSFSVPADAGAAEKILAFLTAQNPRSITLLGEQGNVRRLWFFGTPDSPPMLSGNYFSGGAADGSTAVIGQNVKNKTVMADGKETIAVEGTAYTVLGVMGHPSRLSPLDSMAFLNATGVPEAWAGYRKLTLDGGRNTHGVYAKLEAQMEKEGIRLAEIEPQKNLFDVLMQENGRDNLIFAAMLFCFLLSGVTISLEWVLRQKRRFAVKRLLGVGACRLSVELAMQYLRYAAAGTALGLLAGLALQRQALNLTQICLVLGITLGCGLLSTIPAVLKMLRLPVAEVLR